MKELSICIPTFNHAPALIRVLENFISLPSFRENEGIEIVVSDNASTDETQAIGLRMQELSNGRIRYFRNEKNVCDANFILALSRGTGEFRRLANDTLLYTNDGLQKTLVAIRTNSRERPVLFFDNRTSEREVTICRSLDSFFSEVSFYSTWIGSFGIWAEDCCLVQDFVHDAKMQLTQVEALCKLLKLRGTAVVYRISFAQQIPRTRIGTYDFAKVFGRNYFMILSPYVRAGDISTKTFRSERHRMLVKHLLPFYLSFDEKWTFPRMGFVRFMMRYYWSSPLFWLSVPFVWLVAAFTNGRRALKGLFGLSDNVGEFE